MDHGIFPQYLENDDDICLLSQQLWTLDKTLWVSKHREAESYLKLTLTKSRWLVWSGHSTLSICINGH